MSITLRRKIKKRKPVFARQESKKRKRLKNKSYRKPDGYQSKQRMKRRGKKKTPKSGYSSPKSARGSHSSGLKEVFVTSIKDLVNIEKNSIIRVSSKIALRTKEEIAKRAVKNNWRIANFDAKQFLEKVDVILKKRKDRKKELLKERALKHKKKESKKETKGKKKKKDIKKLEVREGSKKKAHQPELPEAKGTHKEVTKGLRGK